MGPNGGIKGVLGLMKGLREGLSTGAWKLAGYGGGQIWGVLQEEDACLISSLHRQKSAFPRSIAEIPLPLPSN